LGALPYLASRHLGLPIQADAISQMMAEAVRAPGYTALPAFVVRLVPALLGAWIVALIAVADGTRLTLGALVTGAMNGDIIASSLGAMRTPPPDNRRCIFDGPDADWSTSSMITHRKRPNPPDREALQRLEDFHDEQGCLRYDCPGHFKRPPLSD